jgi:hypothetical protein
MTQQTWCVEAECRWLLIGQTQNVVSLFLIGRFIECQALILIGGKKGPRLAKPTTRSLPTTKLIANI